MEEVWKDIKNYEGYYQVSNLGRVKHLNYNSKKELNNHTVIKDIHSQTKNSRGYYCIKSNKKDERIEISIHRSVAQAFPEICGEWFDGCVVHHIDGNKENNVASNLIVLSKEEHQAIHNNDGITYLKVSNALKGKPKTKEHIEKIVKNRRSYKGENGTFYGKKHTDEAKEKNRKAHLGKHPSLETRIKMSNSSTKKRKVIAFKDGVKIKEFASIKEGADYFGLHPQNINQVLKGRGKHCGGYEWCYND